MNSGDRISTMETGAEPKVVYLDTVEAYDRWAQVYDTDGNFLQAIDDRELADMLPKFLSDAEFSSTAAHGLRTIVDLGCGTGRNTMKLRKLRPQARIIGLDSSEGMLSIARAKVDADNGDTIIATTTAGQAKNLEFHTFDIDGASSSEGAPGGTASDIPSLLATGDGDGKAGDGKADAMISTLVIEHLALAPFFGAVARLLRRPGGNQPGGNLPGDRLPAGGRLLLTNMHADMGRISQAGFVDPRSGAKIRPKSYAHTVREVVDEAARWGLAVREVRERDVRPGDVAALGPRSAKWVGVWCWFGITFEFTGETGKADEKDETDETDEK